MSKDAVDRFFTDVAPPPTKGDWVRTAPEGRDDALYLAAIGARIRMARQQLGMSKPALATQSGISERYVTFLESGRCNVSILVLRAVAQTLGMTPAELAEGPTAAGQERAPGRLRCEPVSAQPIRLVSTVTAWSSGPWPPP